VPLLPVLLCAARQAPAAEPVKPTAGVLYLVGGVGGLDALAVWAKVTFRH